MKFDNATKEIKYEVLKRVAELAFEGDLEEKKEEIPYDIVPGNVARFRCCVYKEREVVRGRVRLAMGLPSTPKQEKAIVNVISAACEGCPIMRFHVTDNCQKCMAKKCVSACPFGAISITGRGAYIDQEKCRECGRCAAVCPYNAIADTTRPCKRSCPVDAISMDSHKVVTIKEEKCISCGACTVQCPFGAISDLSFITDVITLFKEKKEVYAMFAPAIEGQFGAKVTIGAVKQALEALGFTSSYEVALGADAVAEHEGLELVESVNKGRQMTTSCCPAFVNMIEKHFPNLIDNMSTTVSPMVATARYIKANHPKAKVVFIGPCIAKKDECAKSEDIDYVLTFEELLAMFDAKKIAPADFSGEDQDGTVYGKQFAQNGGVTAAVMRVFEENNMELSVSCKKCNGAEECKKALMLLKVGKLPENFVEGMSCENGCIGGPAAILSAMDARKARNTLIPQAKPLNINENLEQHGFDKIDMVRHRSGVSE